MLSLTQEQRQLLDYLLPALVCGAAAWLSFVTLGQTPVIRATGLTLVVIGVALALRRLGAAFAITGGLALTYSPAFWSQTGGGESSSLATIVIALIVAFLLVGVLAFIGKRPYLGVAIGIVVFAVIFWSQIGTPRSLRLTSFLTAWLLYLLINLLRQTNPRPEDTPQDSLDLRFQYGLLLLLAIGVLNDPLFVLLSPAVALGLALSNIVLPRWYWPLFVVIVIIGVWGISIEYVNPDWWRFPSEQAHRADVQVPFMIADGWREPLRWLGLFQLVISQFTFVGLALGVIGLARLARWYPVLGVVLMTAYAAYALFGLVYFGVDRPILLLPMLIIQIIWMTYAVYSLGQWVQKSVSSRQQWTAWLAPAAFVLMPLWMLVQIMRSS